MARTEDSYKYKALKSVNAHYNNTENNSSTNPVENLSLQEAIDYIKDSDGMLYATAHFFIGERPSPLTVELPSKELQNASKEQVLEMINQEIDIKLKQSLGED